MLLDPFYGVYSTSTKIAHFLNRLLLLAEFGAFAAMIFFLAKNDALGAWGWVGFCVGGVVAIHVVNLVLRFLWNVVLTFCYGTTDADEIEEAHERKLQERRLRQEARQRRLEEAELEKARRNRIAIEKEWNDSRDISFE